MSKIVEFLVFNLKACDDHLWGFTAQNQKFRKLSFYLSLFQKMNGNERKK
jgi:hypothetical protein